MDGVARNVAKLARYMYRKIEDEKKKLTLSGLLKIGRKQLIKWVDGYIESEDY